MAVMTRGPAAPVSRLAAAQRASKRKVRIRVLDVPMGGSQASAQTLATVDVAEALAVKVLALQDARTCNRLQWLQGKVSRHDCGACRVSNCTLFGSPDVRQ